MNDISQLKADIAEFEAYKAHLEKQQLDFPLDKKSRDVMGKEIMVPTGNVAYPANMPFTHQSIEVIVNGKRFMCQLTLA